MPLGVTGWIRPRRWQTRFRAVRDREGGPEAEWRKSEKEAEEVSERRDRGNRCEHSGKMCAPLLTQCFRNPRVLPVRIVRPR